MSLFPDDSRFIKGTLKRIRFASEDGQFAVCDLDVPGQVLPVTIVGNILSTRPGEAVEIHGSWKESAKFGRQFTIERIQTVLPSTREGIERYLSSGLIEGIGPVLATRIVAHFGERTLDVIDENPMRIKEVEGIGKVRAKKIAAAWEEGRLIRNVMVFLRSHNVSANLATKIYRRYGHEAVEIIQQNPYRLAEDLFGVGFRTADSIAQEAGLDRESMARLRAGVLHVLGEAHSEGHVYLPLAMLLEEARKVLEVPTELIAEAVTDLRQEEHVVIEPVPEFDTPAVFRTGAYKVERDAARHLRRLLDAPNWLSYSNLEEKLAPMTAAMDIDLAPAQREAVLSTFAHKVSVITGGPGTGKTTIVRAVCRLGESLGQRIVLAAPTGRAARRLGEATSLESKTIHRLLEYSFKAGGFQYNEERPLDVDLLIVDEASMIDTYLLSALVKALPDRARLLFVGDIDQLPSVGPGNVLGDIIASRQVGVSRLTEIFRQAQESSIVINAHRINSGQMPLDPVRRKDKLVDFYTIATDEPKIARERIIEMVTERIPKAFGLDPLEDVQILSPMHKGDVGCAMLNNVLQEHFNPDAASVVRGNSRWKVGDKVMQTRNNYEHDVFNGDIGRIESIDPEEKQVLVRFDDRHVPYDFSDLDELMLAYAITVHKSQGSEYPAVIIPMVTQHYVLLQRNLLYTAMTRAKKLVILVGSQEAVQIAVKNAQAQMRYTRLEARLRERD